jgi:hypothetical protein
MCSACRSLTLPVRMHDTDGTARELARMAVTIDAHEDWHSPGLPAEGTGHGRVRWDSEATADRYVLTGSTSPRPLVAPPCAIGPCPVPSRRVPNVSRVTIMPALTPPQSYALYGHDGHSTVKRLAIGRAIHVCAMSGREAQIWVGR